jgi:hypothetical protein
MNLAFDRAVSGPVQGTNYPTYPDALLDWYKNKKMTSVRLMFTWEAVQPALGGTIPPASGGYATYWNDLTDVLKRLLARGIYVTLCPWQYNKASGDTDIVYDSAAFTAANFADFWGKFATAINAAIGNDQRVAFDLINEPHTHAESGNKPGDIGISLVDWFSDAQAAIKAIRAAGATNTIFVPGMSYTAASSFTSNGSSTEFLKLTDSLNNMAVSVHCYSGLGSASTTVLRDACSALVTWARTNGLKVAIGEIAIDAGPNGLPTHNSTFATAQAQWADWNSFCAQNSDVLVGWNWWGNSTAGWWSQSDSSDSYNWGLTLDDGKTQTVYMNLIESTIPVPQLFIPDNSADTGTEPNASTTIAWESPDVWVRQSPDGVTVGQDIEGGKAAYVYVQVTNRGLAPSDANEIVRLYWAKAQAGMSWPAPWDGSIALQGGKVAAAQSVGTIAPGASKTLQFTWPTTPDPANYGGDGHFCLLACVATNAIPEFAGFAGSNLNQNVLNLSTVAWRNIHIVPPPPPGMIKFGNIVVANYTERVMRAQVVLEILDAAAKPTNSRRDEVWITAKGNSLERLREHLGDPPVLERSQDGAFRVVDVVRGIPEIDLRPGEVLEFGLQYVPHKQAKGYAIRVTQFALEDESRRAIGGQTFVTGRVEGFTARRRRPALSCPRWPWLVLSGSLLVLALLCAKRRREH